MPKKNQPWFKYPSYRWQKQQAIVIGGGIAGCQIAWHLCEQGWKVTLLERHKALATEASGNAAGVISPKMTALPSIGEDFYRHAFEYTLDLINTLEKRGEIIEWDSSGVLQITHNKREEKRWYALQNRSLASNFIQLLDEQQTTKTAGISLPYKSSYFPKGAWVNPRSLTKALANHQNCTVKYQTQALELVNKDNMWQVLNHKQQAIAQSEVVIIANGKDLMGFQQTNFLAGMAVAGQTTLAEASISTKNLKTIIGHEGYLTPAVDRKVNSQVNTQHVFGATFEREVSSPKLNNKSDELNLTNLQRYLPNIAKTFVACESGHTAVRMTTPDRFPYVGALPDQAFYHKTYHDLHQGKQYKEYAEAEYQTGLFVLGGFGSRGLTTSAYCANLLSNLLNNKLQQSQHSEQSHIKYCHPARFIIKHLKRKQAHNKP